MADSSPLLSDKSDPETEPASGTSPTTLDDTIEHCIGDFSLTLFLQALLVSLAWAFDAQQTFIAVFTDALPSWHCSGPSPCGSDLCQLPHSASWSWDFPIHTSIISEWGLQCSTSFIKGLPSSAFFSGCLLGGLLLASLADTALGRRNMLCFSCLLMSLSSVLTLFSTNIWNYSVLRFINGFGRATIGTSAIVLSTELVGKRWRGQVGVIGFFCFTLGFLSLPAMAYVNRGSSWRNLYLWTSIPTIFYCASVRIFVHESPRWLFIRGRREEAICTLKNMTSKNEAMLMSFSNLSFEEDDSGHLDLYAALRVLLSKRWASRRLSAVMVTGFGIGLVYYGMPLGLGNLSYNLYLSVTFNALSEVPSSLITLFLIGKMNRKTSLMAFTTLGGISSVLCVIVGGFRSELQMSLELISFFCVCTAFNLELIYTLELFPTCVRNSAIAMVRQALVFGGVLSPVLVAGGGRGSGFLPYGVFGLVVGVCGLAVVGLPDTKGGALCDTIEEEEQKERLSAAALA